MCLAHLTLLPSSDFINSYQSIGFRYSFDESRIEALLFIAGSFAREPEGQRSPPAHVAEYVTCSFVLWVRLGHLPQRGNHLSIVFLDHGLEFAHDFRLLLRQVGILTNVARQIKE